MQTRSTAAIALLATAALVVPACTRVVDDATAVAGPDRSQPVAADASQCEPVDVPLTTIPAMADGEPVMKIPQLDGWDRETAMDSELIRFAIVNRNIIADNFAATVVVTLESKRGNEDPAVVFDSQRQALETTMGVTELSTTEHTLCGLPAETLRYQTPVLGNVAPHPAVALIVVLHTEDRTYAVSVTAQAADADNPIYQSDVDTMLTGFQMLPPTPE